MSYIDCITAINATYRKKRTSKARKNIVTSIVQKESNILHANQSKRLIVLREM
jgi:hypothetical protein